MESETETDGFPEAVAAVALTTAMTITDVLGARRAQPEERVTLDLGVRSLSPTMGVEIISPTPPLIYNNPKRRTSTKWANANWIFQSHGSSSPLPPPGRHCVCLPLCQEGRDCHHGAQREDVKQVGPEPEPPSAGPSGVWPP